METNEIKILTIEDNTDIRTLIILNLSKEGYTVFGAASGEEGLRLIQDHNPHLLILDLMLPGIDGLEVCRRLRRNTDLAAMPILMLTARSGEDDVVSGLEVGADDYLVKPFSPRVLTARVRTLLRRSALLDATTTSAATPSVSAGGITIDPDRRLVKVNGESVELTAGEFKMLSTLMRRPGIVFSRVQLLDLVHGGLHAVTDRAVDVQIMGLRRKLGAAGERVKTVRGSGYKFSEE